ncbi:sugar phosphorylase [Rhodobium gokarnense]|uniref:Sucrose phosphorylase n=1 Tax=Rhodobium gokarnense TaxID=364296 RepID=A0ABT3HDV8_9HYPH|nr:sugar phosphorylase [Rhodobium gokarnense]MCW2308588.1 sucrose phosphorylase [Rhodobium gokarnense]
MTETHSALPDSSTVSSKLTGKLKALLKTIYPDRDIDALAHEVIETFWSNGRAPRHRSRQPGNTLWSERDSLVITYGNTVVDGKHKPLDVLYNFLQEYLSGTITGVHILPFFPYTSDGGFSVTDYYSVNSGLGDWEDIRRIAVSFKLMSDLVLNHVSSQSTWFSEYLQGHAPYDRFFCEASPDDDLSAVVRPRAHALLREVETPSGTRHVWCTFSHDQVDVDFSNPDVLLEFLRIMRLHIDKGVRIIRLDAVAFLWKEIGTSCINLPETHAIVRLMRVLCDYAAEPVVLLTETNVPKDENLSYFGNRNEAHAIYNFSLPPLLLQALLTGSSRALNIWQMRMPPAQLGCAYLNFTASHDGIGLRPAEGLIAPEELDRVIETVKGFGGLVSMRSTSDGKQSPYELNVSLIDAMKGTVDGPDEWQFERFICSQTIMMGLEGIPAFYIHSLLGTPNDLEGVEKAGINRAINRRQWDFEDLKGLLADKTSLHARVLAELTRRIGIRAEQPGFHPNATQFTLHLGDQVFGIWRQSLDRSQSIFSIANVTKEEISIPVLAINLIDGKDWADLLTGERMTTSAEEIVLAPYQCRWIANRDR